MSPSDPTRSTALVAAPAPCRTHTPLQSFLTQPVPVQPGHVLHVVVDLVVLGRPRLVLQRPLRGPGDVGMPGRPTEDHAHTISRARGGSGRIRRAAADPRSPWAGTRIPATI